MEREAQEGTVPTEIILIAKHRSKGGRIIRKAARNEKAQELVKARVNFSVQGGLLTMTTEYEGLNITIRTPIPEFLIGGGVNE